MPGMLLNVLLVLARPREVARVEIRSVPVLVDDIEQLRPVLSPEGHFGISFAPQGGAVTLPNHQSEGGLGRVGL